MFGAVVLALIVLTSVLPRPTFGIVGGVETIISDRPFQVSIEYLHVLHCGGSILNPTLIITAANCTDGFLPSSLSVRAGSSYRGTGGQNVQVKQFINHPQFDKTRLDYDISILQLSEPLKFAVGIAPIELPRNGDPQPPSGSLARISGWGLTAENGNPSLILRRADVPIVSRAVCLSLVAGFTDRMMCAGYSAGGIDRCNFDSGGPMEFNGRLVGIVSRGVGCARALSPGVYTYVANLRNWIDTTQIQLS